MENVLAGADDADRIEPEAGAGQFLVEVGDGFERVGQTLEGSGLLLIGESICTLDALFDSVRSFLDPLA